MSNLLVTPVDDKLTRLFGPFLGPVDGLRVNLRADIGQPYAGFINMGPAAGAGIDIRFDLEACASVGATLRFSDASVDVVLAIRVLERVCGLVPLLREVARVLKPGGHLLVITPYVGSDNAWENPENVRAFSELSWAHLPRLGVPLLPAKIKLVPFPDVTAPTDGMGITLVGQQGEFEFRKRYMRNVVAEMHVALEKVEA